MSPEEQEGQLDGERGPESELGIDVLPDEKREKENLRRELPCSVWFSLHPTVRTASRR